METENKKPEITLKKIITSIYFKIGLLFIIFLLLMIPKVMIEKLIFERKSLRNEAVAEVSEKWGQHQEIQAGIIAIPYSYHEENITALNDTTYSEVSKTLHILPTSLTINGELIPKEKYRGIYKIPLYQTSLQIDCEYAPFDIDLLELKEHNVKWGKAQFILGINDLAGINENININHHGKQHQLQPIDDQSSPVNNGLQTKIDWNISQENKIKFNLSLNGSEKIEFAPLGQETEVTLSSTWSDPSFLGEFLPDTNQISNDGFTAKWKIQEINRPLAQYWTHKKVDLNQANFGVSLFIPVDHYTKSMRSIKYAILTIIITFSFFVFIEILGIRKLHIIQFTLVGLSLILFYSLLISLSEHISFNTSYWIAASATIVINLVYTIPTLKSAKITTVLGVTLAGLYGFIFFLLQLESYALLVGNIGLFIILSIIMIATRKVKWQQ